MVSDIEEIPIIWKKPHNSSNLFHIGTLNILLDQFIKRYRDRLQIQQIMIDLEMPKDAAGYTDKTASAPQVGENSDCRKQQEKYC